MLKFDDDDVQIKKRHEEGVFKKIIRSDRSENNVHITPPHTHTQTTKSVQLNVHQKATFKMWHTNNRHVVISSSSGEQVSV